MATASNRPNHILCRRIVGLLHARPMMNVELGMRLPYSMAEINNALAMLLAADVVRRIGQRWALVESEAESGPDAA